MKLAWEPKVSLGNVISAVALVLVGFTSYATFTSRFDGMTLKQDAATAKQDALTIQVTAQGVNQANLSGDVKEIKATQAGMQSQLRDMSDRLRDLEKRK